MCWNKKDNNNVPIKIEVFRLGKDYKLIMIKNQDFNKLLQGIKNSGSKVKQNFLEKKEV